MSIFTYSQLYSLEAHSMSIRRLNLSQSQFLSLLGGKERKKGSWVFHLRRV